MKFKSLDDIWVKILSKKVTDKGILIPNSTYNERTDDKHITCEVVLIGSTILPELLGNDKDGYLKVGDMVIVDKYLPGVRDQVLTVDGDVFGLIRPHNIKGYEPK